MTAPEEPLLKPCPFCLLPVTIEMSDVSCVWSIAATCIHNFFISYGFHHHNKEKLIGDWNNTYCWKLLAEKEAEAWEHLADNIRLIGENERLKAKLEELAELNVRAKEVLEKTLDLEASACVARNRLEAELKAYIDQVEEYHKKLLAQRELILMMNEHVSHEGSCASRLEASSRALFRLPYCDCKLKKVLGKMDEVKL